MNLCASEVSFHSLSLSLFFLHFSLKRDVYLKAYTAKVNRFDFICEISMLKE